ncbi:MAG TPA: four helix bundle protein [Pyrinomonadaceae bacterium]|nr:four helix bundle protein [Pyrinomonadaceae bacterium]
MSRTNFENLRVYILSEDLADRVWTITTRWDHFDRDTVGKQIVRSADSIGANIAEGTGRYGIQDNKRFGYFARGSLNETKHWLRRAYKRNLLTDEDVEMLKPLLDELSPKLNAYIKSIKAVTNREQPSTNDEQPTTL